LGTLTLTGSNTYTGVTAINAGIVNLQHVDAFGSDAADTTVNSGGTLQLQGGLTFTATDEALTVSGSGAAGQSGALVSLSGTNAYNRTLTLGGAAAIGTDAGSFTLGNANAITGTDANLTFNSTGNTTVSGIIATGAGTLVKNGLGTLTLSGANSYTGGTTINAGIVNIQNATALGTTAAGTTVAAGATLQVQGNITVAAEALNVTGTGAVGQNGAVVNVSGTNVLSGAVTLGGNTTIASDAGTQTYSNAAAITGSNTELTVTGAGNTTVSGIIDLGSGGVTKNGLGILTLSGANIYDGVTAITAGIVNAQNNTALGSTVGNTVISTGATLQLQGNITTPEAISLIGVGASGQSGALVNVSGNNSVTTTLSLTGATTMASLAGLLTVDTSVGPAISGTSNLTFTGAGNTTIADAIATGVGATVTKTGTGTLTLSGTNTYTGATTVQAGTLAIGANNTLVTTSNLTLGATAGTAATVDMSSFSQTVGSLNVTTNSATNVNQITIGAGKTLQVNGNVTVGYNSGGNTTTKLNVSGAGTFGVTGTNTTFQVGGNITTDVGNSATLDMSGLANFSASLGTGTFRVGDDTNSGGNGTGNSTVILATTSTITAAAVDIESDVSGGTQTLRLGNGNGTIDGSGNITSGGNTFNVATLNVGFANGRSSGVLNFNNATDGTFKLRAQNGTGRALLNVGLDEFATGTNSINSANLDGHYVDLLVSTLTVANRTAASVGSTTATFAMDTGRLDATGVVVGSRTGALVTTGAVTGTLDIGGGTVVIGASGLTVANNTTTSVTTNAVTGNVLISGGTVSVGTAGIILGNTVTAGMVTNASLTITGGTLTMGGDIAEGAGANNAATTSTLTLNGGTLNMGGFSIGSAANSITNVNLQSGTLSNVNQINNGGAVSKTTSGTLTVAGSNTYTGATTVADGTLHVAGVITASPVTVNKASATLATASVLSGGGNGTTTGVIGGAVTVGVSGGVGVLRPGTIAGADNNGTLTLTAANTALTVIDGSQIQLSMTNPTVASSISFDNGTYTFNSNTYSTALAMFDAEAGARNTWNVAPTDSTSHDFIRLTGTLSSLTVNDRAAPTWGNGSIAVSGVVTSPAVGQVFNLLDWVNAGTIAGNFDTGGSSFYGASSNVIAGDLDLPQLGSGLGYDVSAFSRYGLIVVVPEPGRITLVLIGVLALVIRRRRPDPSAIGALN
jgi:autotransporter-associated beta strand protein